MTARTPSQSVRRATARTGKSARTPGSGRWTALPPRLRAALAAGVLGGALLAVGPLLPVLQPATPAGFASGPLLFVLGLLPAGVAVVLAARGSVAAVSGTLLAAAVFVPGRALADVQLAIGGSVAARPEFALPTSLVDLRGDIGLWLLLAGHVVTLVAGVLARGIGDGGDLAADTSERRPGSYQGPVLLALGLGALAAVGLVAAPFTSESPFLLARGTLDLPVTALVGGLLVAVAVPLAATIAVTSADPAAAKGWLLGSAAVVLAVALPRVVAGLAGAGLGPSWGPYLAVVAAAGLVAFGLVTDRTVAAGMDTAAGADTAEPADLNLPGQSRLHLATGVAGLFAAGAALVAADTALFVVSPKLPHTTDLAGRPLIPAAAVIAVCAVGMLVPRWAAAVRPAFAVAWAAVLLAGTEAFDTALTANQFDGVRIGPGFWASGLAMLAALVGGCCAALAGGVERDDVDISQIDRQLLVLVPGAVAALLAIGAFGLPVLTAAGYTAPGIWSHSTFASWGLVLALVVVAASALLAGACRPRRAVALLFGGVGVLLVRVLAWPLHRAMVPGATAGAGFYLALGCLGVLLLAAGLATALIGRSPVRRG